MQVALFMLLPVPSHLMPCFDFARECKKKGYDVIFTGTPNLQKLVEDEGFKFYYFRYATSDAINSIKAFIGILLKSILDKNFTKFRFREFYSSILLTQKLCSDLKPTIVFTDEGNEYYYFVFKKLDIHTFFLNTKLSIKKRYSIPPYNSTYKPKNNLISNIVCEFLWQKHFIKLKATELVQKFAFCWKDELYFQKRYCKKMGWDFGDIVDITTSFHPTIKNIPTIILAPEALEFNFSNKYPDELYFHTIIKRNENNHKNEEYANLINEIKNLRNEGFKIIYCSFGTLINNNKAIVDNFILRLINSISFDKNILLVLSRGGSNINIVPSLQVRWFDFLPQIDFLNYVDLMITHGGLGSIKECYDANVPMLLFPLNKEVDQNGNANRVMINGFGLKGNVLGETEINIRQKIIELLNNKIYLNNLLLNKDKHDITILEQLTFLNLEFTKNSQ